MSKEKDRDRYLREHYGITLDEYWRLFALQGEVCAICGAPPRHRALSVDHDHHTQTVRGLLCYRCNRFLVGKWQTGELLRLAADYLDSDPDPIAEIRAQKEAGS